MYHYVWCVFTRECMCAVVLENLIGFVVDGVNLQDFLSCENDGTSGCRFRNTVADVVGGLSSINAFVSFYNDSVQVSTEDTQK